MTIRHIKLFYLHLQIEKGSLEKVLVLHSFLTALQIVPRPIFFFCLNLVPVMREEFDSGT